MATKIKEFDGWVKVAKDRETMVYARMPGFLGEPNQYFQHVYSHYEAGRVELFTQPDPSTGITRLIAMRTRGKTRKIFDAIQNKIKSQDKIKA